MILFDSKKTTKIEERYQSNKGELLAFIWACQKHRFLLYPRRFIFVTDHIALKAIKTMSFPRSLSLRWLDIVSNFNFSVEYRKAKLHGDVDFLSRHVARDKEGNENGEEEEEQEENNALVIHQIMNTTPHSQPITEEEFKDAQDRDEDIQTVKQWLESGETPGRAELLRAPIEQRQYLGILPALQIQRDGLLVRKKMPQEHLEIKEIRPCIPKELQENIIMRTHGQAGHVRLHKMFHLILQRYWLPTPVKMISMTIAKCTICQKKMQSVGHQLRSQRNMIYTTRCSQPMEMLYLDFFGKLSPS